MVKRKSLAWRNFPKSIFLLNFFPFFLKRHRNDINHVLTTVLAELQAFAIANNCLDSSNVMNQKTSGEHVPSRKYNKVDIFIYFAGK